MTQTKSLARVFKYVYPFLAVLICLTSFACIFNTFNLALYEAFYNLLLLLPLFGFFLVITGKYHIAVVISSTIAFILYYIDELVYAARLTHIRYSDFSLISQAARVADRYNLTWSSEIARRLVIIITLCLLLVLVKRYYRLGYPRSAVCILGFLLILIGTTAFFSGILPHKPETFNFTAEAQNNGLVYSWYCQYHESKLVEPEGYSKAKAEEILAAYEPEDGISNININVIMNHCQTIVLSERRHL